MNFLSLEYFIKIAKSGNISTTAKELYISQQSLSEHISKLESELNTVLFKRSRPMQLTPTGMRFLDGAQEILAVRDQMIQDIRAIEDSRQETIFVGESCSFNPLFMSDLVKEFVLKHPALEVVIRSINIEDIPSESDIDLFFLDMPGDSSLENIPLTDNDMYMVIVQQKLLDEIYADRWPALEQHLLDTKDLSLLKDMPYIMTNITQSRNSRVLEKAFEYAGFKPKIVFRSERNGLNFEMCYNGVGALFAPMWMCKTMIATRPEPKDTLRMYPISIRNWPAIKLGLGYHKNKKLTTVEHQFIELTKEFMDTLMA